MGPTIEAFRDQAFKVAEKAGLASLFQPSTETGSTTTFLALEKGSVQPRLARNRLSRLRRLNAGVYSHALLSSFFWGGGALFLVL